MASRSIPQTQCLAFRTGLLAALVLSASLATAQAQPYHRHHNVWNCRAQVELAQDRLDRAIARHGGHSIQAVERRRELMATRDRCWRMEHRWWDPRDRRWHDRHW
ncbi:MAG: hypothetical protein KGR48_03195 [Alphaproteobacteria bacterium]|nr:hypothetical protein [Alphaproteobacteria bacterium]MBU6471245.1 hypothetical protein [Alphaproteobacteria bacterium]MDE2014076.1 hypothetical protein [Alphaproteobacteria bacterium]MDE2073088.1 hypothetical protein [Alphaproteobacteria bacterium]MDE2352111.1 hypothetical protein [Alphaproteobacteria bacterium]